MIDQAAIDAIADAVVERLRAEPPTGRMLTVAEVADRFGISRDTVYANATAWGGVKVGSGPKSPWRFDADLVAERLGTEKPSPAPTPRTRRRPASPPSVDLLPVRR